MASDRQRCMTPGLPPGGHLAPTREPDVTTMAGVFLIAWSSLDPEDRLEPLVMLQALPGAFRDGCVAGPDREPWRVYVFSDGSRVLVDAYATQFRIGRCRAQTSSDIQIGTWISSGELA